MVNKVVLVCIKSCIDIPLKIAQIVKSVKGPVMKIKGYEYTDFLVDDCIFCFKNYNAL